MDILRFLVLWLCGTWFTCRFAEEAAPGGAAGEGTPSEVTPENAAPMELTQAELDGARAAEDAEVRGEPPPAASGASSPGAATGQVAAAGTLADVQLPAEWSSRLGGVKSLSELEALATGRITEEQAAVKKWQGAATKYHGDVQRLTAELAALKGGAAALVGAGGQPNPEAAFDAQFPKGRFYGFANKAALDGAFQANPELANERYYSAQGVLTQKQLDKILTEKLKPITETETQRTQREQKAQQEAAFSAFDAHMRGMCSAVMTGDPRFSVGGALWAQLQQAHKSPRFQALQRAAMEDPSFNPFEVVAREIAANADVALHKGRADANAQRLRQTGAGAGSARPGAAAAGAGTGATSQRETTAQAASWARSRGQEISAEEEERLVKILEDADL